MEKTSDLSTWNGALVIKDFGLYAPDDQDENRWPTVAHIAWGPDGLYIAVEASDPRPDDILAWHHKRDEAGDQDGIAIYLDPSGNRQTAIHLGVTPFGGQVDSIVREGSGKDFSYDALWDSAGVRTSTGYVVKLRVPYGSLRRSGGPMGLRVMRFLPRDRSYGISWPRISKDIAADLVQLASVDGGPKNTARVPVMFVPFATFRRESQALAGSPDQVTSGRRLGFDARYSTTGMTLEGTYRPDFGDVEADVDPLQVNSRFKVYYPEKRPFFLEGMNLLAVEGAQRQFSSRSLLAPSYGVKVTGQAARGSWSLLQTQDDEGGAALASEGAIGVEGLSTRDLAAAFRFQANERGSGVTLLGTDRVLLGGPIGAGGRSGGVYLDHYFKNGFSVSANGVQASARIPEESDTTKIHHGTATSLGAGWSNRHWWANALTQATSPDLVLVSGFTDLQGYRLKGLNLGWQNQWNAGYISQASLGFSYKHSSDWEGRPLDQTPSLNANLETVGRFSFWLTAALPGNRSVLTDGVEVASGRTEGLALGGSWNGRAPFQPFLSMERGLTLDLESAVPARSRTMNAGATGNLGSLTYQLDWLEKELQKDSGGDLLLRARRGTTRIGFQLTEYLYLKAQAYSIWYTHPAGTTVERYFKFIGGWQPNAFTHIYLGWSGRRRRDPDLGLDSERTVEKGLYFKAAYAFHF